MPHVRRHFCCLQSHFRDARRLPLAAPCSTHSLKSSPSAWAAISVLMSAYCPAISCRRCNWGSELLASSWKPHSCVRRSRETEPKAA
eukprot:3864-Heterococcus_DN1.PRE.1